MKLTKTATGLAALATASALALLPVVPVQAAEPTRSTMSAVLDDGGMTLSEGADSHLTSAQATELAELDNDLPAIERATAGGAFDYTTALALGVDERVATEWARGVILAGGRVVGAPAAAMTGLPPQQARAACRGSNSMWSDWLGWHAKLDSCNTKKVIDALRAGVGATTVASIIVTAAGGPIGAVSAIMPAMLTWSAASIEACSRNGTGVEVAFSGFICWAQ